MPTIEERRNEQEAAARAERLVDAAAEDSFPASDPPSWWAGP